MLKILILLLIIDLSFVAGTIWVDICKNNKIMDDMGENDKW